MKNKILCAALLFLFISILNGQDKSPSTLVENFQHHFQKEYLCLNLLFQTVIDYQSERTNDTYNGISLENMRFALSGNLDQKWHYQVQVNFVNVPLLLDANLSYKINQSVGVKIGRFKTPFSKEYLTSAAAIDFVNRSQVITQLAPGRQLGLQLAGSFFNSMLHYQVGMFNGNQGNVSGNNNNAFLYTGRISFMKNNADSHMGVEIGLNAAISQDRDLLVLSTHFSGERRLIGGDIRAQFGSLLMAGEYVHADLDGITPGGYYGTLGWALDNRNQLLLRFDSMNGNGITEDKDFIILGWNYNPSQVIGFQLNYLIDQDLKPFKHHQILINSQFAI